MLRNLPFATRILDAVEGTQALDLALAWDATEIRLRVTVPNENKAFARTRSFAFVHLDPLPSEAARDYVIHFIRALARIDPGGVSLDAPRRSGKKLDVIAPGGSWSRSTFDAHIDSMRAREERFGAAVLVVTQACEMACTFCPVKDKQHEVVADGGIDHHLEDLVHQLRRARELGASSLELGGNDVLRFPHLHALLEEAKRLGYTHISAQSPGQSLADRAFAEALSRSPLDAIDVPIYGLDAAHHDAITGTPGSFDTLTQALDHARTFGRPEIRLRTLALHQDALDLDALIAFAQKRFGLNVTLSALRPNRVGEREHLRLAASFVELKAIAHRHAARFETEGPLCILPREQALTWSRHLDARQPKIHLWDLGIRGDSEDAHVKRDRERVYLPMCDSCAVRTSCAGVLRGELDALGETGLVAIAARASAAESP
jgi:MoaA/NifB/PqqE/SkfB family radical SAM enzyme